MNRKALFIDIDGTLVSYENRLPKSAKLAIFKARQKGHLVIFNTGRSKAELTTDILDIGFDGLVLGNGNYVEVHDDVIYFEPMSLDVEKKVVDWLHSQQLEFYLESNNGLFASENFREKSKPVLEKYMGTKNITVSENFGTGDIFPQMIYDGELYREDVNKISFILDSYQDHLDSKLEFPQLEANTWGGAGELALFGDLGVKDINKRFAIEKVLKHLEIDIKDTVAFGDAKIDIPMLEICHIGVAMGNGGDEIKAIADFVTDSVEDDGLYNAFEKMNLI